MKNKFLKFLSTPVGSWLKVALAAFLGEIIYVLVKQRLGVFHITFDIFEAAVTAAVVGTLPVLINYLNPKDPRYGAGKKAISLLLLVLPFSAFAQVQILDSAQQIVIGKVERVLPIGSVSINAYVKNSDTTYTFAYICEGGEDRSASATFKAGARDLDVLYSAFISVLVTGKDVSINLILGSTPIVVTNYIKNNNVRADIKIRESSFLISKEQLNKLFGR